jgi:hypothetical protein
MTKGAVALAFWAAIVGSNAAMAADDIQYPKQAYDATYNVTGSTGSYTMRMASDGKGHVRTENNMKTGKVISLMDYPGKTMTNAMEAQKMIMTMPLRPTAGTYDEAALKKNGAKSLGAKTMDGHPCHGWESTSTGAVKTTTDSWIGDDTHYLVHSETTMPGGKQVMALKSWSDKAPADITDLPKGYKEMKMPGAK